MESKKLKLNPYKILNISKNYDESSLKKAFIKRAMIVHPDKGGEKYKDGKEFKLLTISYQVLLKTISKGSDDKVHDDLKKGLTDYLKNEKKVSNKKIKDKFDLQEFNKIYENNKINDDFLDDGYGNWLKQKGEETSFKMTEYNENIFNDKFNELKKINKAKTQLKIYEEPQELISLKNIDSLTVLGGGKVSSYSGEINGLGFRDLREAFEESTLIDPSSVNISDRKMSIKEYNKQRSKVNYDMTDEDKQKLYKREKIKELNEKKRLERLNEKDEIHFDQYSRIHQRLIG
jgi:curved DNA-binding protein CbpA